MMTLPDSDSEDELPPGWEERVTADAQVYYVNHLSKATQWTHPRTGKKKVVSGELPFGWERCIDKSTGKVLYIDHENHRTTYTDPRLAFATEEKEFAGDFRQRFDASSTALQVLHGRDLTGMTALITGANTGIGFETARSLAKHGCQVIFGCRNMSSAQAAVEKIKQEKLSAGEKCDVLYLDLASLKSVQLFADAVKAKYTKLNMLILNAGVFGLPFTKTEDDYEATFQINHLSHFYLTLLLYPLYRAGTRIVVVSSESHRNWWVYRLLFAIVRPFTKSLQQAASTTVFCATALELNDVTGLYFNNCCRCDPSDAAKNDEMAEHLWHVSADMVSSALGETAFGTPDLE